MIHAILFIIVAVLASFLCALLKVRDWKNAWPGAVRFAVVLVVGVILLGTIIQVTQSLGGISGIVAILMIISVGTVYYFIKPRTGKDKEAEKDKSTSVAGNTAQAAAEELLN
jgi:predicted membrane channel-forming protein YqfA (hemolysin III family)